MKRKHPVKIKPNQHQGDLMGSVLRPASLAWMPLKAPRKELCGQLPEPFSSTWLQWTQGGDCP